MKMLKLSQSKKQVILLAGVILFIVILWSLSFQDCYRPEEYRTDNGLFTITKEDEIRRIHAAVQYSDDGEAPSDGKVTLADESGTVIWEGAYSGVETQWYTSDKVHELIYFERGAGITVMPGTYRITTDLDQPYTRVTYKLFTFNGNYRRYYFGLSLGAILLLAVLLAGTVYAKTVKHQAVLLGVSLVCMGMLMSFVLPPLSVPDEQSHYLRAYAVSSRMMFQKYEDIPDWNYYFHMRETDALHQTYLQNAADISYWFEGLRAKTDTTPVIYRVGSTVMASTPSYTYFFPAVGITIGRLAHANGCWTMLLGRLFNLIGVGALLAWSVYLMPFGRKYLSVLLMMPEVIYLAASFSYDGLNLALCCLYLSFLFRFLDSGKNVGWKDLAKIGIPFVLMIPIKVVYALLGALLLLIPKGAKTKQNRKLHKGVLAGIGAGVLLAALFIISRMKDMLKLLLSGGSQAIGTENTPVSMGYILRYPMETFKFFIFTIYHNADDYLNGLFGEFVGRDQSGDVFNIAYFPTWMILVLGLLLAAALWSERKSNGISAAVTAASEEAGQDRTASGLRFVWWQRLLVPLSMAAVVGATMVALYLSNNVIGDYTVRGIQGRYFLPLMLLLPAIGWIRSFRAKQNDEDPAEEGKRAENGSDGQCPDGEWDYIPVMLALDVAALFMIAEYFATHYF